MTLPTSPSPNGHEEIATLAGGCFWCLDATFRMLRGVREVVSGYTGGHVANPDYYSVGSGDTGHAEAVQVYFDPSLITYRELLEVFFTIHDPTTLNRQGADAGTQYRSIVLTHSDAQRETAREVVAELTREGVWDQPIVTEVVPLTDYYPAEPYHQNYFADNP